MRATILFGLERARVNQSHGEPRINREKRNADTHIG
jgi:hypothetical protein